MSMTRHDAFKKHAAIKIAVFFLASLAFSSASADSARLKLWVTDAISTSNAAQCHLTQSNAEQTRLPTSQPTLTEHDVRDWNPKKGLWSLNPKRFGGKHAARQLQDRCFVLAIDGKLISSGVVLSVHSARLINFPTIRVNKQHKILTLQLNSGNRNTDQHLIHADLLDAVLSQRTQTN